MTRELMVTVVLTVVLCAQVLAGILICPRCGHEIHANVEACQHCGADVPKKKADAPGPREHGPSKEGSVDHLAVALVEADISLGKKYIEDGDVEMARILFRNAAALEMLVDPADDGDRAGRILRLTERCRAALTVRTKCPKCEGTGKAYMVSRSLSGELRTQTIPGKRCTSCRGNRYIMSKGTVEEQKYRIGQAVARNMRIQQARKYVPIGGAWVPQEIARELTITQKVTLRLASAPKCERCSGIGLMDCAKCKGSGSVECDNSDCDGGVVKVEAGGRLGGKVLTKSVRCPICLGDGRMNCLSCSGKGNVLCKRCSGAGERPVCRRCGGQGMATCRRCKGNGFRGDAVCKECRGIGDVVCSSCMGEGRKR